MVPLSHGLFHRVIYLGWLVLSSIPAPCLGAEDEGADPANTVTIMGRRRESLRTRRTGQSVTLVPTDATRFDSLTLLKRDSAILAPETGRISPSGFVVPRIRGQDVKLADVYLEDILLQNPYSGLPLIEDLDLRAFGALESHQGVPPPAVPGLNPIGTLRYRFRDLKANRLKFGLQTGRPFGWSSWSLGEYHAEKGDRAASARLYARHHQTNGQYQYYSDQGTPYNTADDVLRTRSHNDQRSMQAVPFVRGKMGPYSAQGLGWLYQSSRSLPSMSEVVPSDAREGTDGHLAHLSGGRDWGAFGPFDRSRVVAQLTDTLDHRQIADPGRRFLASAEEGDMKVKSRRGGLNAAFEGESAAVYVTVEDGLTSVRQQLGERLAGDLERHAEVATLGTRFSPSPDLSVEVKAAARHHADTIHATADALTLPDDQNSGKTSTGSTAAGGSVGYHPGDWGVYAQWAGAKRLPSLVEEFGDGGSIRPNSDLNAELTHHREIGLSYQVLGGHLVLGGAAYHDETWNKIVFVPVLANAVKARNVRATDVLGGDLRSEVTFDETSLYLSLSRLFPYDKTSPAQKVLPGIPEKVAVVELEQKFLIATWRWLARYRSEVYRDLANSVQLPGAWIHDASVDYKTLVRGSDVQVGLSIRNVFNVLSAPIYAPETPENRGRTAYSDVAGAPLPGRQWLLTAAVAI